MNQRLQGPAGIDKRAALDDAMASLRDGMTILVGGFGERGFPFRLIDAVLRSGVAELTLIKSDANEDGIGIGLLIENGRVRRITASHIGLNRGLIERMQRGEIEVEICPQGILAERIRAGGAGLGGLLSDIGIETMLAEGKRRVTTRARLSGGACHPRRSCADPRGACRPFRHSHLRARRAQFQSLDGHGCRSRGGRVGRDRADIGDIARPYRDPWRVRRRSGSRAMKVTDPISARIARRAAAEIAGWKCRQSRHRHSAADPRFSSRRLKLRYSSGERISGDGRARCCRRRGSDPH